jgi:hypothetical protein
VNYEWRIHMGSAQSNGAAQFWANGSRIGDDYTTGSAGDGPMGLALGGWLGINEVSTSQFAEVIAYDRVLSNEEIAAVYSYLNGKFAVYTP